VPLSEDLRSELAAIAPRAPCDRLAQLSGLAHSAGSLQLSAGGRVSLRLDLASPAAARRAFSLLRAFRIRSQIRTYPRRAFEQGTRYQLNVSGEPHVLQVLHEAGIVSPSLAPLGAPPKRVVARGCCRSAYLRGALLGAGSLSGPRSLHLELRSAGLEGARFVASVAAAEGARLRVRDRGRHAVAYAKGKEAIGAVLAAAGASGAVLLLEERAVLGSTRARANRVANADHANLVRTGRAAHEQLRAVRRLQETDRLEDLPATLREVADLRQRHPSLPLRELALRCRPPATKAAVHRRLRKLIRLAEI
jgi:cell division protein WhiA